MKLFAFIIFVTAVFSTATVVTATPPDSTSFYLTIKNYDLGKLWHSDSIQVLENEHYPDGKLIFEGELTDKFPEPYGFIGHDYQRFYIHYLTIKKDTGNAYRYVVTGKTKVKDSVRIFFGTITITRAKVSKELTTMIVPKPENKKNEVKFKQGVAYCDIKFSEDTTKPTSGTITGKLTTRFYLDSSQHIFYDNLNNISDNYCNNQFIGIWKKNKTDSVKRCNWGDYRIPACGDLDEGAGGFSPSDKYLMNGWQNYRDAYSGGNDARKAARAINGENLKWWKY
jgi:hypothetical protein